MVKGWNPLIALVRTPYGYEDLGNSTHPNHKRWEQLRFGMKDTPVCRLLELPPSPIH